MKAGATCRRTTNQRRHAAASRRRLRQRRRRQDSARPRRRAEREGIRVGPDAADVRRGARIAPTRSARCSRAAPTRRVTTKTIDVAQAAAAGSRRRRRAAEGARGRRCRRGSSRRRARCRRRCTPRANCSRPARFRRRTRRRPAAAAARRQRRANAANNFDPEEINPPVASKGGMTALLHAARQGYIEAARALLDGGAKIDQLGAATRPRRC